MGRDPSPDYHRDTALIVVDVQNDFADPEGSLFVPRGDEIIAAVNVQIAAARAGGSTVVLTQDWHPPGSPHFDTWPVHCVRGTWGARLHPDLDRDADLVVRKGTGGEDGYSAFTVIDPASGAVTSTGLAGYLRARYVSEVVVVGLATDVCVKATAIDALDGGFATAVLARAARAVEATAGDGDRALAAMRDAGASVHGAGT